MKQNELELYRHYIERLEQTIKVLKDERANITKTHAKNIANLQATIEAKEIVIKDKSAIMDAMVQPKTCEGCKYSYINDKYKGISCSQNVSNYLNISIVNNNFGCLYFERKEKE